MAEPKPAPLKNQPSQVRPLFRQGFKLFFLGAGVWSLVAIALWLGVLQGTVALNSVFDPTTWHAHEMIFGYTIAVMAGFLLTAIPNWTGRLPLQGSSLMVLFGTWCIGRLAVFYSASIGATATMTTVMVLDLAFLTLLLGVVLREIIAGQSWRNLPMPFAIFMLLIANSLTHIERIGNTPTVAMGLQLGIMVMIVMICLIGGRIIPSFTHNWLKQQNPKNTRQPAPLNRFDIGCLFVTLMAGGAWVAVPEHAYTGIALITAAFVNMIRLSRWCGHLTLSEPLGLEPSFGLPLGADRIGITGAVDHPARDDPDQHRPSRLNRRGHRLDDPRRHDAGDFGPFRATVGGGYSDHGDLHLHHPGRRQPRHRSVAER
jgi:uncharacterized protein involved in response to NO